MHFDCPTHPRQDFTAAKDFAAQTLLPRGGTASFDRKGWREAAASGLFRRLRQPSCTNGSGNGAVESARLFEAMGLGGADRSLLFAMGAHLFGCLAPLVCHGSPELLALWDRPLRDGSAVGALAVTEPAGNSTFDNIATEARPVTGGYRISGDKTLVTNAPVADVFIVLARETGRRGAMSLTAFVVPTESEGLTVSALPAAGLAGAPMGNVSLDACFVPESAVLGRCGAGLRVFSTAMQWERSCLLAGFLGAAERDLAMCRDFVAARHDAEGPLLRHQAVSHRLARVMLSLQAARLMLYRAASLIDEGRDDHAAAAMAKIAVSEAVVAAAEDVFRLLAGTGWRGGAADTLKAVNDAHGALLASGTTEMQLELLARHLPSLGAAV